MVFFAYLRKLEQFICGEILPMLSLVRIDELFISLFNKKLDNIMRLRYNIIRYDEQITFVITNNILIWGQIRYGIFEDR